VKVAATDLAVTITEDMFGCVFTIGMPRQTANNAAVTLAVAFTIAGAAVTSTLKLFPIVDSGRTNTIYQAFILATSNNAGKGTPAKATEVTVTILDGEALLIDDATTLSVESLNMRDIIPAA
jgi:hypothetical protein